MAQKKLLRFSQLKNFTNVLEKPGDTAGNWHSFFNNNNPIILELACGRGEYTIGLAKLYPDKNFIGVDLKGNRLYIGAKYAADHQMANVAFLRCQIDQLDNYFAAEEVAECWITFPDPHLRTSKAKKRLTHPSFLRIYQKILVPGGLLHLKTDSPALYYFTKRVLQLVQATVETDNLNVNAALAGEELAITTHYQNLDIAGKQTIFYLKFKLPEVIADKALDTMLQSELKVTEQQATAWKS